MQATAHPTDESLSAYGLGRLDGPSAQAVQEHLEGCDDCRRRVGEVSSDSFLGRFRAAREPAGRSTPGGSLIDGTISFPQPKAPSSPPPADTLPPGLADHPDYQIRRELGRGGMGVVYLAHNTMMGRDEVLKVIGRNILARPGGLERFQREIKAVAKLRHPNIVVAHSAFRLDGGLVFAMEYVEGLDLARLVKAKGPLPVAHAAYFIHQAALGLQHAHERGMVHRDIKPHNLMLTHDGKARVIKVLDFGLAKATREEKVDGGLTSEGQALGTPDYIAPEQIVNAPDVDTRADIYSLGGTLFYLLTGRPPFVADSLYDLYQAHMSRDIEPLNLIRPEIPAELAALVSKMMAKEPRRRFQTPGEVAEALKPFFKSKAPLPRPETTQDGPSKIVEGPTLAEPATVATMSPETSPGSPEVKSDKRIAIHDPGPDQAGPTIAPSRSRRRWLWPSVAAASLLSLSFIAGIIVLLKTPDGTIALEGVPKDAEVRVDGHKIAFTWPGGGKPITTRAVPGQRKIEVEKDGFKVFGESVSVQSGETEVITVRLVPDDNKSSGNIAEERAKLGGDEKPSHPPLVADRSPKRGDDAPRVKADGGLVPLFNGIDLSGWKTDPAEKGEWRVEDGLLIGSGKGISHLYTVRDDLRDFRLRIEARFNAVGHSAVLFHSAFGATLPPADPKYPKAFGVTINSDRGSIGNTGGFFGAEGSGEWFEMPARIPAGQWFVMDLLSSNDDLEVVVDGRRRCVMSRVKKYSNGSIALRQGAPGGVIEFRSIMIEERGSRSSMNFHEKWRLIGHDDRVSAVAFSADGNRLLTGGNARHMHHEQGKVPFTRWGDTSVRLWDLSSGRNLWTIPGHDPGVRSVAFEPDGSRLASCGGWDDAPFQVVKVSETDTGRKIRSFNRAENKAKMEPKVVEFSREGDRVLQLVPNGTIRSWNLETEQQGPLATIKAGTAQADEFPSLLLTADQKRLITGGKNGPVELWDLATGNRVKIFTGHRDRVHSLARSADDRLILSGGWDHVARLWDVETGRQMQLLDCEADGVRCVAISPDGRHALTGGHYGPITLWDLGSGKQISRLEGHTLGINCLAFSPDGLRAASGSEDRTARVWELEPLLNRSPPKGK